MPKPIYTRKGDKGNTSLFSGERVEKISSRVEAYGTVDECNACLGVAKAITSKTLQEKIQAVQEHLFYLLSELATTDLKVVVHPTTAADVQWLETTMDALSEQLPPARNFVVPGGTHAGASLHLARTVSRRAERQVIRLAQEAEVNPEVIRYLNRLSDFLFVLARYANIIDGSGDLCISKDGTYLQTRD